MTWNERVDAHVAEIVRMLLNGADLEDIRRNRDLSLAFLLGFLIADPLYDAPEWGYQWGIDDANPHGCNRVDGLTVEFIGTAYVMGSHRGESTMWVQPFIARIRLTPDRRQLGGMHLRFGDAKVGLGVPDRQPNYWPDVTDWALDLHWTRPD